MSAVRGLLAHVVLSALVVGCAPASPGTHQVDQSATSPSGGCPALPAPPAGACRTNADCKGNYVECQWRRSRPGPRPTGSGALFGTDDVACQHGFRQEAPCPPGQAFRTRPAANLCPVPECIPRCTASSCATGEQCDQGSGLCKPVPCTHGWTCTASQVCQYGLNSDPHGCAPRCPGYGRCVVYGPPLP